MLYAQETPKELIAIEQDLFEADYPQFLRDLSSAHPEFKLSPQTPSPSFKAHLKRNEKLDYFISWTAEKNNISSPNLEKFKAEALEQFTSYSRNLPYARLDHLELLDDKFSAVQTKIKSDIKISLPESFPPQHTLDIKAYTNQRFPQRFQKFVTEQKAELFLHDTNCEEASAYQKSQGFKQIYRFMGARDAFDSQFLFVYNPKQSKYRFTVCELHGRDDVSRIVAILGPSFHSLGAHLVLHRHKTPLIEFNDAGQNFIPDQDDRIVIGFQNTVWWQLFSATNDWQRTELTNRGTDVALFFNKKTKVRIVSMENVYGDEMNEALNVFYKKGFRRYTYLGTAGGFGRDLHLGDILLPDKFEEPDGTILHFKNDAITSSIDIEPPSKIIRSTLQGWVPSLVTETISFMTDMQNRGVNGLDIEARYFAEFFFQHPKNLESSIVLTVSDLPLGSTTYTNENQTRAIPMKSIKFVLPQILAKASDSKRSVASTKKKTVAPEPVPQK